MDRLARLGLSLAQGGNPDAAFRLVYGAGMDTLISRAQATSWIRAASGGWAERSWPPAAAVNETLLSRFDAELLLGELAAFTGAVSESQQRYEKALAAAGRGPDSHSRLAMLALRRGDRAEALRLMQAAGRAGARDARMWYEYALLLRESGAAQEVWVKAARRATELDPENAEAWFILGSALQGGEAVNALARAAHSAQSRSWIWEAYGRALLNTGRNAEARAAANEALKRARRPTERAMADGLMADIDAPPPPRNPAGPATVTPGSWRQRQTASSIDGRLVEVDCAGRFPVLVIESPVARSRISVKQTTGLDLPANMNFTCGPQPAQRLAVFGHDAQPDTALRSTGDLRSIRFK
jgi:tetratricopeptide (TPR) repeat protein